MSAVPTQLLTPEEYLARERRAEYKSEFYRGEMFATAGSGKEHCRAKDNLAREAGMQLKHGTCELYTSDMRVKVSATGLYTYPDIVFVCENPQFEDAEVDTLLTPRAVVEVLSDSTEKYDRGTKFDHYSQIASLQEYVLAAQNEPKVERRVRQADGNWLLTAYKGLDATLEFASVPVRVPLAEIYRGVEFPERPLR